MPYACYLLDRKPQGWSVTLEEVPIWLCSEKCGEASGNQALAEYLATGKALPQKILDMMILRQLQERDSEAGVVKRRTKSIIAYIRGKK